MIGLEEIFKLQLNSPTLDVSRDCDVSSHVLSQSKITFSITLVTTLVNISTKSTGRQEIAADRSSLLNNLRDTRRTSRLSLSSP